MADWSTVGGNQQCGTEAPQQNGKFCSPREEIQILPVGWGIKRADLRTEWPTLNADGWLFVAD